MKLIRFIKDVWFTARHIYLVGQEMEHWNLNEKAADKDRD